MARAAGLDPHRRRHRQHVGEGGAAAPRACPTSRSSTWAISSAACSNICGAIRCRASPSPAASAKWRSSPTAISICTRRAAGIDGADLARRARARRSARRALDACARRRDRWRSAEPPRRVRAALDRRAGRRHRRRRAGRGARRSSMAASRSIPRSSTAAATFSAMPVPERRTLLILGGTADAAALARAASEQFGAGLAIITSLAGRTTNPAPIAGALRSGGFGGALGLEAYLRAAKIDLLIDATHPFAAQISRHARLAAAAAACRASCCCGRPGGPRPVIAGSRSRTWMKRRARCPRSAGARCSRSARAGSMRSPRRGNFIRRAAHREAARGLAIAPRRACDRAAAFRAGPGAPIAARSRHRGDGLEGERRRGSGKALGRARGEAPRRHGGTPTARARRIRWRASPRRWTGSRRASRPRGSRRGE